jgi:hypothetical protein
MCDVVAGMHSSRLQQPLTGISLLLFCGLCFWVCRHLNPLACLHFALAAIRQLKSVYSSIFAQHLSAVEQHTAEPDITAIACGALLTCPSANAGRDACLGRVSCCGWLVCWDGYGVGS